MSRIKALALAAAMTLGLAPRAFAQLEIGVKAGLTFATLSETDLSPNFKSQTGFVGGVHFGIPLGTNFLLQPEGLISQQGAGFTDGSEEGTLKLSYLVVPLNLRINLGSGTVRPFLLGGPYAAFQLSCSVEDIVGADCDDLDLGETDWGLDFGGGIRFSNFFAEARYNLGLKNINDVSEGFDTKQRVFMVMIGIAF